MKNSFTSFSRSLGFLLLAFCATQTAQATPKVGETFGDWVFSCAALAENKTACALTQTIISQKDNKRIVKFSIEHNDKKNATVLTAVLPLGIHLPDGVNGTIDDAHAFQFTLQTCLQFGCIASYTVDNSFMKTLQSGQKIGISFTGNGAKKPFSVNGSLKGLREGIKAANIN